MFQPGTRAAGNGTHCISTSGHWAHGNVARFRGFGIFRVDLNPNPCKANTNPRQRCKSVRRPAGVKCLTCRHAAPFAACKNRQTRESDRGERGGTAGRHSGGKGRSLLSSALLSFCAGRAAPSTASSIPRDRERAGCVFASRDCESTAPLAADALTPPIATSGTSAARQNATTTRGDHGHRVRAQSTFVCLLHGL